MGLDRGRPTSAREPMDPVTAGALVLVEPRGPIVLATQRRERTPHVLQRGLSGVARARATCVELAARLGLRRLGCQRTRQCRLS